MKINEGVVQLNVFDDILDGMTKDQKLELARLVCWDDDVLSDFVARLMTEYASDSMDSHIHRARMKMIKLMPEAAANVIRALVNEAATAQKEVARWRDWAWDAERTWPRQGPGDIVYQPLRLPRYEGLSTPCASDIMRKCGYLFTAMKPCGCVICTCEDDNHCQGCGAKYCEEHSPK